MSWQLPQQVGGRRLRTKLRHQLLDLILGSPGSAIQDLDQVALVEDVAELDQRGEVESAGHQVVDHEGKPRRQSRGRRSPKCRRLGQPERIDAQRKERRVPQRQDGPPPIQLAEVMEELYEQAALGLADVEEAVDEDVGRGRR
jgi:hypothetical protein